MTSIHFVVHPLPGSEDQLNERLICLCFVFKRNVEISSDVLMMYLTYVIYFYFSMF